MYVDDYGKLYGQKIFLTTIVFLLIMAVPPTNAQMRGERLKVGLVLGGGGAKGAAEVGVLKVIEESGIPIDYIAGTSIGSIVGGLYSCGYRADELDSLFRNRKWMALMIEPSLRLDGMIRGDKIVKMLEDMTGRRDSISFDNLPIPFRCVAVDETSEREIVLSSGNLPKAMRASMSVPFIFDPVEFDSMHLVDGGVLNNLPVDVVRQMGADVVIAIDLTQNKHATRKYKWKRIKGIGWLIEWIKKRPDLVKYNENRTHADIYINPDLRGYSAKSFKSNKIKVMIDIGTKAGLDVKPALMELKKKIYEK